MSIRHFARLRVSAFFTAFAVVLSACGSDPATPTTPATPAICTVSNVDLSAPVRIIFPGGSTTLQATATHANCATAPAITFTTSASNIATVTSTGTVTGVVPGDFVITAASGGRTATVNMTVAPAPVNTIEVNAGAGSVIVGQTLALVATTKDAQGATLTGRTVTWSSAAASVASVSASGVVTGVAAGSAMVTATSEGKSTTVSITVSPVPVSTVVVTVPSLTMAINTSQQATAVARDPSGTVLTGRAITWSTSNAAVGIVTSSGLVTSIGPGAVAITATIGGASGLVAIAVPAPPAPTVSAVAPLTVDAVFLTVPIAITGTNFQTGATSVAFTGTGITSGALAVNSSTSMTVPLFIASGTTATPSDVTVTTFGGTSAVRQLNVFAVGSAPVVGAPVVGGPGGATAYTVDCPVGSVATGANARVGAFMDNFQLRCQTVTGANRAFGAVVPSNNVGGNGGTPWVLACNPGSVMTGISGSYTSALDPDIVTIRAICSPIDGGATQVTTTAGGAPGAGTFSSSCPLGLVMVGMQGAYGALVDRVQPRCR